VTVRGGQEPLNCPIEVPSVKFYTVMVHEDLTQRTIRCSRVAGNVRFRAIYSCKRKTARGRVLANDGRASLTDSQLRLANDCYRWAHSDRFNATPRLGPVGGFLSPDAAECCNPKRLRPIVHLYCNRRRVPRNNG